MARRRLTRAEQQQQTRQRLLGSATKVLGKRGYHGASVEEVAREAGLTRGAVYANFADKEDLFFACLDQILSERMPVLEQVATAGAADRKPEQIAQDLAGLFGFFMGERLEWFMVFVEFVSHAAKSPGLRERITPRLVAIQDAVAQLIEAQSTRLGMPLPADANVIAAAAISLTEGFALRRLADPKSFPEQAHQAALGLFFQGVASLSKDMAQRSAQPSCGRRRRRASP
jgi:AcrR family transcriptional regulator